MGGKDGGEPTTQEVPNPDYADLQQLKQDISGARDTLEKSLKRPEDAMHDGSAWTGPTAARAFTQEISGRADQIPGLSDGFDPVILSEPIALTSAEAESKGDDLAQQILDHNRTDEGYVDIADKTLDELRDVYGDDPEVLSAFYAKLGPQAQTLLTMYEASGGTDPEYVEKVSETFGTAFKDSDPPQGFWELRNAFNTDNQGDHSVDPMSWERLAMLQYGDFPPDFVRDAVNANGLDAMNSGDIRDWRGNWTPPLGLPEDNRALIFGALKNNPEATRWALDGKDLNKITKDVYAEGDFDWDLQQNFIDAMKAGSGTNDEQMGEHSPDAAEFAFNFIRASAAVKDVPDSWATHEGLADIAASYAPELIASSNDSDAQGRGSSMDLPDNYDVPAGLDPDFFLSQDDVYKFLHGFGGQDERFDPPHDFSAPFDEAVGKLYNSSLVDAAAAMKKDPTSDVWQDTLRIYGNLSGLHLQAQLDVRGDEDASDQATKDLMSALMLKGVGLIPTPQGLALKGGLMAGKFLAGKAIKSWRSTDPESTRVALAEDADVQASFLTDYQLMSALQQADYPGTNKIPPELLEDGHLKAPGDIAADAGLIEKYQDFVDKTDVSGNEDLDSMTENGTSVFRGGLDMGQNRGTGFGWDD